MYLTVPVLIIFILIAYKVGKNDGIRAGRQEMEDELVQDQEKYSKLRYDYEIETEPLDD
jgi:hypothetical protein